MELGIFLKGILLGFSIAAPVGPIGILCIQKTVRYGRFSGLFSGLGAATADAMYVVIAMLGLTALSSFLIAQHFWINLSGALFLLYLGWKMFFSNAFEEGQKVSHKTLLQDFLSTFFLTLTNPMTILAFIAVLAGLGITTLQGDYFEAMRLVSGVFLGSCAWWLLLSEGITLFRHKVSLQAMHVINKIAGISIAGFGLAALFASFATA